MAFSRYVNKPSAAEQRWSTGTRTRLPPMWPGFDSGLFTLIQEVIPRVYSGFLLPPKAKFELICCVLVEKLSSAKYTETYYHY